jgi:hypothetical protein
MHACFLTLSCEFFLENFSYLSLCFKRSVTGVHSKNNEYHIVNKVENVCVNKYIFDLIDNVVFVVLALYSRVILKKFKIEKGLKLSLNMVEK